MEFKIKVTVFGNMIYDVDAKNELEARQKAKSLAEKDYTFDGNKLYFGLASFLCPGCKKQISTDDKFCSQCGKNVERGENECKK